MRLNRYFALLGGAAVLLGAAITSDAQRTPPVAPGMHPAPRMGGIFGRRGRPMMGGGQIIGNKNTKVYHLAGDTGNMPAEKNRVYFRSEREAMASGYHAAKNRKPLSPGMHGGNRMPHRMMGGSTQSPANGKMNGTGGHLPK